MGWIEGRNLQIEYGWAGGEPGRIQASAKELVGLKCEVIAARSTPAVAAVLKETRAIPIVFTYVFDPVAITGHSGEAERWSCFFAPLTQTFCLPVLTGFHGGKRRPRCSRRQRHFVTRGRRTLL